MRIKLEPIPQFPSVRQLMHIQPPCYNAHGAARTALHVSLGGGGRRSHDHRNAREQEASR